MTHDALISALHWFWAAFFLGFGIYLIWQRGKMGSARSACCIVPLAASSDAGDWDARIRAAIMRREEAEGSPPPTGWWMGSISIILGFAAVFSKVPDGLLYAVLCLTMSVVSGVAFLHLRNTQRKRVAVLAPRTPDSSISPVWFALSLIAALSVLTFLKDAAWALPAVLVCASSIASTLIAWRLTQLGSILSGVDLPAEQLIDNRLRIHRSSMVLMFAFIQPFVFVSQILHRSGIAEVMFFVPWAAWMSFLIFTLRRQRSAVRVA